jgi:hypothetical protein
MRPDAFGIVSTWPVAGGVANIEIRTKGRYLMPFMPVIILFRFV